MFAPYTVVTTAVRADRIATTAVPANGSASPPV